MITNKDIRVENGNLVLNGDKFPLDGQSPETIMQIVEDNSDTTPTENSDAPITSGGVFTADKNITDTIGDLTQTGVTGADVAEQLGSLKGSIKRIIVENVELTDNIPTIGANDYEQYTISATKSGYTPIGVIGITYTGGVGVDIARFYVDSTNVVLLLHNVTSSTYTPTKIKVSVLYIES